MTKFSILGLTTDAKHWHRTDTCTIIPWRGNFFLVSYRYALGSQGAWYTLDDDSSSSGCMSSLMRLSCKPACVNLRSEQWCRERKRRRTGEWMALRCLHRTQTTSNDQRLNCVSQEINMKKLKLCVLLRGATHHRNCQCNHAHVTAYQLLLEGWPERLS